MSQLREIMRRLNSKATRQPDQERPVDLQLLGVRSDQYARELQQCTDAMLQYEWAWLEQHSEALELCLSQPDMLEAAGGQVHVRQLLAESLRFQDLLADHLALRSLKPALHRGTLVPTEHAWELRDQDIRRQWGIHGPHALEPSVGGP